MGMFDSIMVPCPTCGKKAEYQSKGGDCNLDEYTLHNAPLRVLADADRHGASRECSDCGAYFQIVPEARRVELLTPGNRDARVEKYREGLKWIAQTVHQAYHAGEMLTCPKSTCIHAQKLLGDDE